MYYVYCGICPNKSAYDLYCEYIKAADGYCHDELQEEAAGTWGIYTRVDYSDWFDYSFKLRFQRQGDRIVKSEYMTALEKLNFDDIWKRSVAASDSDAEEWSDHGGEEYDDLYCYEHLN